MIGASRLEMIPVHGFNMWVRVDKEGVSGDATVLLKGVSPRQIAPSVFDLPPNAIVLDVGAFLGMWGLLVERERSDLKIAALEPEPYNYGMLVKNLISNGSNILPLQFALTPKDGIYALRGREDNSGSWTLSPPSGYSWEYTASVFGITLNTLMDRLGIGKVDYIKLDIEGHENELIEHLPLSQLYGMEIELHNLDRKDETVSYLESKSFEVNEYIDYRLDVRRV